MGEAGRVVVRAELRRRWRSYLSLAVVVLVSGAVALGSLAGARRTASAFDRYLEASNASDLAINVVDLDEETEAVLADLPGVESVRTYAAALLFPVDPETFEPLVAFTSYEAVVSLDGRFLDQDTVALVDGRLPGADRADEVLINRTLARRSGLGVGDELHLALLDPETFEPFGQAEVQITGVGITAEEVAVADIDALGRLIATPAMVEEHPRLLSRDVQEAYTYWWTGLRLAAGADVAAVEDAWEATGAEAYVGETNFRYRRTDTVREGVVQATRPAVVALGAFGGVAGALALALVLLAVRRSVRSAAADVAVLHAVGATRSLATLGATACSVLAVVLGALAAAGVAALLSPLAPIGPVRAVEPDPGIRLDPLVLAGGALAIVLVGAATAVVVSRQRGAAPGPTAVLPGLPLPPVVRLGAQFALGRRSAAARTAVIGAVLATVAVVATLAFGQSLRHLESTPRLFGADFDVALQVGAGYAQYDPEALAAYLDDDPPAGIEEWAAVSYNVLRVDAAPLPVLAIDPGRGSIGPTMAAGRAPNGDAEVALGVETMAALGVGIGDRVEVGERAFEVVGTTILPALGQATGDHPSLGIGAWMTGPGLRSVLGADPSEVGASAILLRIAPGTDVEGVVATLETEAAEWGLFPEDLAEGAEGMLEPLQPPRPAELAGSSGSGAASVALSGTLFFGALVALLLALAASVRLRRRQLAVLKAIGFTSGQVLGMIVTQALVTMLVGAVVGIPLGIASGSALWRLFAEDLGVLEEVVVPFLLVLAVGAVGTVLAMVLAAVPGLAAARLPTALALRSE